MEMCEVRRMVGPLEADWVLGRGDVCRPTVMRTSASKASVLSRGITDVVSTIGATGDLPDTAGCL